MQTTNFQTRNINSLLQELRIESLDFLQIDTEGYDAEIILTLDLDVRSTSIINFEHSHLSNQVKKKLYKLLESHGYLLVLHNRTSGDSTAYKSEIFSKFSDQTEKLVLRKSESEGKSQSLWEITQFPSGQHSASSGDFQEIPNCNESP